MLSYFYHLFCDTDYIFPHSITLSKKYTFFFSKTKDYTIPLLHFFMHFRVKNALFRRFLAKITELYSF